MQKLKKTAWLLVPLVMTILILLCLSCSEDALNDSDFVAGETFTDSDIRVLKLDTLTVVTSTMKFDSIITTGASRMLIGKYTDPIFGTVQSSSYIEVLPTSYAIDSEAVYDSIVMVLNYDGYYYNDTLQHNAIHIKQLSEQVKPAEGDNFYNTSTVDFVSEDIGLVAYAPRPLESDSLQIKLSDTLGLALFDNLQQKVLTNADEFTNFLYGMTLRPDENDNGSVIGFSLASSFMRLYYSVSEEDGQSQSYTDFTINTGSFPIPFFNQITAEQTNEYLTGLTNKEINLDSQDADNQSFVQSGIGITTRIEFPYLKSVFDIKGQGTLLDATLRIKPKEAAYNDALILRDTLSVFIVDQNNDLIEQLLSASGASVLAILNRENQEFNDIFYEIPLGSYIEELLLTDYESGEAMILLPDNYNATVDRFILDGENNSDHGTSLELTYAIYDEDE